MYRVTIDDRDFTFVTQPGVFSADGPDAGSMLLLETVLPHVKRHHTVLDLGTGAGLLGTILATRLARGEVWMTDVDIRAVRAAQHNVAAHNITNAHVLLGDGARDLPERLRFDLVVSNPPTHDGTTVLRQLVEETYRALKPRGSMWVVVNRLLSIKRLMLETFGNVETEAKRAGFVVLRSTKDRRLTVKSPRWSTTGLRVAK